MRKQRAAARGLPAHVQLFDVDSDKNQPGLAGEMPTQGLGDLIAGCASDASNAWRASTLPGFPEPRMPARSAASQSPAAQIL